MKKHLMFSMLFLVSTVIFTACGDKDNESVENPTGRGGTGGTYQAPSSKLTRLVGTTPPPQISHGRAIFQHKLPLT